MKMLLRSRRFGAGLLTTGLVLFVAPVAVWAQADSDPGFASFDLAANTSGFSMQFGDPATQPYPVAAGTVPETQTTLGSGGGFALAAVPWFGPLASNVGSLANLLQPFCTPPQIGVCQPGKVDATPANYPVRAEASSGGTEESTLGPLTASVKDGSDARAALADMAVPGLVSAARVASHSRSYLENGTGVAVAETSVAGFVLGDNVVKIDAVHSMAKAVTDGEKATREQSLVIEGLEVGGQRMTIDDKGVHYAEEPAENPAVGVVKGLNESELLTALNLKIFLTEPLQSEAAGSAARADSGALAIQWIMSDGSRGPTCIPTNAVCLGGGYTQIVLTLGGAGVRVQSTPGITFTEPDLGAPIGDVASAPPVADLPVSAPFTPSDVGGGGAPYVAPTPVAPGDTPAAPVGFTFDPQPASFTKGVSPGVFMFSLIGALFAALGLRRLQVGALLPGATAACPLERRTG